MYIYIHTGLCLWVLLGLTGPINYRPAEDSIPGWASETNPNTRVLHSGSKTKGFQKLWFGRSWLLKGPYSTLIWVLLGHKVPSSNSCLQTARAGCNIWEDHPFRSSKYSAFEGFWFQSLPQILWGLRVCRTECVVWQVSEILSSRSLEI